MTTARAWALVVVALCTFTGIWFVAPESVLLGIFVVANVAIFCGYFFVSVNIAPRLRVTMTRTRVGGIIFFLTCGLTHLELAAHALTTEGLSVAELSSWHMFVIHGVQACAIWAFVSGLYIEFVQRPRTNPLPPPRDDFDAR